MIRIQSLLEVSDNTGVNLCKCLHIYNKNKLGFGTLADTIKVSIRKKNSSAKINKKIVLGLIIHVNKNKRRKNGFYINFLFNRILLLQEDQSFFGDSKKVPLCREIFYNTGLSSHLVKKEFV